MKRLTRIVFFDESSANGTGDPDCFCGLEESVPNSKTLFAFSGLLNGIQSAV